MYSFLKLFLIVFAGMLVVMIVGQIIYNMYKEQAIDTALMGEEREVPDIELREHEPLLEQKEEENLDEGYDSDDD
jgi:hypothetical protein